MLNEIDLPRVDLNLLVLFDTVLREGHIGWAAESLSLSPSAVSHGLGRPPERRLGEPATPHALGNQGALVLGHRATDLQQQMIVRVVAHRLVEELGGATGLCPLLHEHHLVHVIAREAVSGAVISTRSTSQPFTASRRRSSPGRASTAPL